MPPSDLVLGFSVVVSATLAKTVRPLVEELGISVTFVEEIALNVFFVIISLCKFTEQARLDPLVDHFRPADHIFETPGLWTRQGTDRTSLFFNWLFRSLSHKHKKMHKPRPGAT